MKSKKKFLYFKIILLYVCLSAFFYLIGGEQLKFTVIEGDMPQLDNIIPVTKNEMTVEQAFEAQADFINQISFYPYTFAGENEGTLEALIIRNGEILNRALFDVSLYHDTAPCVMDFSEPLKIKSGEPYLFKIIFHCEPQNAPSLYYSDNINTEFRMLVDGTPADGALCLKIKTTKQELFGTYYWYFAGLGLVILLLYLAWIDYKSKRGKPTALMSLWATWLKYKFLIEQLVSRDFKIKYKRSVLGYCWSFLNPLMTMLVQYVVFSQIFKMGIENFPVYLLSGNIIFSFFQEAVGQGLTSIISNASLITKVYVPKYIYPATKVISSSINLFISIIPLLLVTILTGTRLNFTLLLLPYAVACMLVFCMGMVFALSAANVFFRDVQYLWGIASLIWMYATPIFYPAEIVPQNLKLIQTLNPLYHIISFVRTILIDGVSPSPIAYLACFLSAFIPFVIGCVIFKKTQGKFILYI